MIWTVEHQHDGTPVVTCEARDIAVVEDSYGDGETHAHLIAAAPDLLKACQHLVRLSDDPAFVDAFSIYRQALPLLKGAIKKTQPGE